jgi:hypothetical protein
MARSTAKTSSVNRGVGPGVSSAVSAYVRDLDQWPRSWMGLEKDLPPGEQLLAQLRPFIEHLASSNLSPRPFGGTWITYGCWEARLSATYTKILLLESCPQNDFFEKRSMMMADR